MKTCPTPILLAGLGILLFTPGCIINVGGDPDPALVTMDVALSWDSDPAAPQVYGTCAQAQIVQMTFTLSDASDTPVAGEAGVACVELIPFELAPGTYSLTVSAHNATSAALGTPLWNAVCPNLTADGTRDYTCQIPAP